MLTNVECFGLENLTSTSGILAFAEGVAYLCGNPVCGLLHDFTESYNPLFILGGTLFLCSGVSAAIIKYFNDRVRNKD